MAENIPAYTSVRIRPDIAVRLERIINTQAERSNGLRVPRGTLIGSLLEAALPDFEARLAAATTKDPAR